MKGPSSRLRLWWADPRGASAVEFAVILPFMLFLYIGGVELAQGMSISVKVTETAHIVTDLAAQNSTIDNSMMSSILNASAQTIAPYSTATATVTVSEVSTDSSGVATVTWSDSLNGTSRPAGQVVTLPASIAGTPNISLIFGEVAYSYTPQFGYALTNTINISDSYFLFPRMSTSISRTNS